MHCGANILEALETQEPQNLGETDMKQRGLNKSSFDLQTFVVYKKHETPYICSKLVVVQGK